ncbi:hypothetical protein BDV23DRAFT_147525 [Aspergillus alliaceus]|uniref:Uncharacterized protein n=1 Tax=Petromyces alliaceus TaxID=209559 RepID=A0A5N7CJB9_PETAA|nr:hypothetical protein BDV23DRAFT_147525 [Aspergillus alliaceus]
MPSDLRLMCAGDMTLIPIKWSENRNWIMPIFETIKSCRGYDAFQEWSRDRDAANPDLLYKNAARLHVKGI